MAFNGDSLLNIPYHISPKGSHICSHFIDDAPGVDLVDGYARKIRTQAAHSMLQFQPADAVEAVAAAADADVVMAEVVAVVEAGYFLYIRDCESLAPTSYQKTAETD